jgi:hypothetical protein
MYDDKKFNSIIGMIDAFAPKSNKEGMQFSNMKDYIPPFIQVEEGENLEEIWNYYVERYYERNKKINIVKIGQNQQNIELATDSGSSWKIYERKLIQQKWTSESINTIRESSKEILSYLNDDRQIIEKQVVDTNSIESFVESFSKEYFSWQQSQDSQTSRNERLKNYLTENLQQLNTEMVRSDIPTSSIVNSFQVWSVTQNNENVYDVLFSVGQQITEGENKKNIISTYTVTVYVDEAGNMVIIKNPTINSKTQKSNYEPVLSDSDGTVDAVTTEEINSFLDTFFKLYPTATEKELSYYVSNQALDVVNKDYVFVELVNPVYTQTDNQMTVTVTVKYLDKETKVTQLSQFELTLQKNENWKIIKNI